MEKQAFVQLKRGVLSFQNGLGLQRLELGAPGGHLESERRECLGMPLVLSKEKKENREQSPGLALLKAKCQDLDGILILRHCS